MCDGGLRQGVFGPPGAIRQPTDEVDQNGLGITECEVAIHQDRDFPERVQFLEIWIMVLTRREIDWNEVQLRTGQGREQSDFVAVSRNVQIIQNHREVPMTDQSTGLET